MKNTLGKIIGYPATLIHGDTAVFDRWLWLRKNLKKGNLRTLDAGCGSGAFTMYAAKCGNETIGISFDEKNNKVAEKRAKILKIKNIRFVTGNLGNLDNISDKLGKFDQIICFETIEHILNDEKLVKDFADLLRPSGRLLLTAPYKNYYKCLLGDDKTRLSVIEDGGHVRWGYTHEEMEKIFNKAGLKMDKKEYASGIISQLLIALYRRLVINVNHKIAWLTIFPLRLLVILDPLITNLFNLSHLSIAVVGLKKI